MAPTSRLAVAACPVLPAAALSGGALSASTGGSVGLSVASIGASGKDPLLLKWDVSLVPGGGWAASVLPSIAPSFYFT